MFNNRKVDKLEEQLETLRNHYKDLKDDLEQVVMNAKVITKERDSLQQMVRKQNESAILLISLKLVDEIKSGGSKIGSLENTQNDLLRQREELRIYTTDQMTGVPYRYINQGLLGNFI